MTKRRNFTDQFKAKIALEALRSDKSIQEIAAKHQLHPNQVSMWERLALDGMAGVFAKSLIRKFSYDISPLPAVY